MAESFDDTVTWYCFSLGPCIHSWHELNMNTHLPYIRIRIYACTIILTVYSGMQKFGHLWSKFLLLWIVKWVADELISKRHKDETFFLTSEARLVYLFGTVLE